VASNTVLALGTAPSYGAAIVKHDAVTLITDIGIEGDRHAGKKRAVSIVCTGELARAATDFGSEQFDALRTRRNIVVDLDELPRSHGKLFTIGEVEFAVWRDCAPCTLMDEIFGDGAQAALRQRAGITASVIRGGIVRLGDTLNLGNTLNLG
jgi:MOSC domain-containing protein YiiM